MKITRKLKDKKGVSILLALLIIMICAVAGAGAISMAAANVGRYSHAAEEQQAYYSVTSAATLVRDVFDKVRYTSRGVEFATSTITVYDEAAHNHTKTTSSAMKYSSGAAVMESTSEDANAQGILQSGLGSAITYQFNKIVPFKNVPDDWYERAEGTTDVTRPSSISAYSHEYTITSSDISIGTVVGRLFIYDDYNLSFSFTLGTGSGNEVYSVSLYLSAEVKEDTQTAITHSETTNEEREINTTTRKVIVTWPKALATISRGQVVTGGTNP